MTVITSHRTSTPPSSTGLSRRSALRGLGGVTVAALLAAGAQADRAMAQAATPSVTEPLFTEWAAAWSGDTARVAVIYADDVVGVDYATGERFDGADSIRSHIEGIHAGYRDLEITLTSGFICGNHAALEYVFSGTYIGQQPAGSGLPVSSNNVTLFELADGKIVRETHYYDYYSVLKQLGALPGPSAASTPAAASAAGGPTLEMVDDAFNPTTLAIAANTDVTVTLTNKGIAPHNVSIDALKISVDITPGATKTVTINAPAGTYEFYCNVPGHKAAGMVGTLTVA
jgi:steroid delta-isomerase-like uncharacterized protein